LKSFQGKKTPAYFGHEEKKFCVTLTPGAPEAGRN
jgi:hypothetical protein